MYRHVLPGLLILLLYFKTAHTQQLNPLNSQQGVPQFQGNLNNPNQFSAPNSFNNVQNFQQVNLQELLNSVNVESQKNILPQMNCQRVDYQQNPSASNANLQLLTQQNQQISQTNAADANLSALPPQMSSLSSEPNPYCPRLSSEQGIYLSVPENSESNAVPLSFSSQSPKLSNNQNQPIYSFVPNVPQNTLSQQGLLQNSIVKQNPLLESSNPSMSCQQNTRPINLIAGAPIITSIQYEPAKTSPGIASMSNSPEGNQFKLSSMRFQPAGPSVQSLPVASSTVNQPNFNSMKFQPAETVSQISPTFMSPQFQPVANSPFPPSSINQAAMSSFLNQPTLRSVQVQPVVETQPEIMTQIQTELPPTQSSLISYMLSQFESSKTPKYPKTIGSMQKSKSSLKKLLPLILDVLKDRQTGCGCCNCGCMNNNNNEVSVQEPTIFGGYSNQKDYGANDVIPTPNNKDLIKDYDSHGNVVQNFFRQNVINTESAEESDENDSDYDDDD